MNNDSFSRGEAVLGIAVVTVLLVIAFALRPILHKREGR